MHFAWRAILELSGNPVAAVAPVKPVAPVLPVAPDICAGPMAPVSRERMLAVFTARSNVEQGIWQETHCLST